MKPWHICYNGLDVCMYKYMLSIATSEIKHMAHGQDGDKAQVLYYHRAQAPSALFSYSMSKAMLQMIYGTF